WCVAQVCRHAGVEGPVASLLERSQNYRNVFDPEVGMMRGRLADGAWRPDFKADEWGGPFTEGSSWHYTWRVLHDVPGLIELIGGDRAFIAKLDEMLAAEPGFSPSECALRTKPTMSLPRGPTAVYPSYAVAGTQVNNTNQAKTASWLIFGIAPLLVHNTCETQATVTLAKSKSMGHPERTSQRTQAYNTVPSKPRRSPCPIACTLDLVGDKWTLLVVRDLLLGRSHFREFLASPEKIATNVLSDRLMKLVEAGLVDTEPSGERAGANAYRLTKRGESLAPLVKQLARWGLENLPGTEARLRTKS
ncbi:MAG: glycoside hydrolase domain-containing protein, partial [Planctomycetota bacterium]